MADRYTKVVLTVIAVALVWLCLWGQAPKWGTPAEAATRSRPAAAAKPPAARQGSAPLRVEVVNWYEASLWPVEVTGTVDVDGPIEVTGTVDVDGPIEVTGTVDVDEPVEVEGTMGGYPVKVKVADY